MTKDYSSKPPIELPPQLSFATLVILCLFAIGIIAIYVKDYEGFIIIIIGISIIVYGIWRLHTITDTFSWNKHNATITESELVTVREANEYGGQIIYYPKIEYLYVINGRNVISDRLSIIPHEYRLTDKDKVGRILNRYYIGKEVTIRINPDNTEFSILLPGSGRRTKEHYFAIVLGGLLIVALGVFVFLTL